MSEIKYEKIDNQNIRKWDKDEPIVKSELNVLKANLLSVRNMNEQTINKILNIMFNTGDYSYESFVTGCDNELNEIDYLLDLYNNSTTEECIDFIDE
jgi:hypothetical protein